MNFGVLQGFFDMLAAPREVDVAPAHITNLANDLDNTAAEKFVGRRAQVFEIGSSAVVETCQFEERTPGRPKIASNQADPERDCWPHDQSITAAMNRVELDLMQTRITLFTRHNIGVDMAESLADKLMRRDREGDDRSLCLECVRFSGQRCGNYFKAGLSSAGIGGCSQMLQRCPGFSSHCGRV